MGGLMIPLEVWGPERPPPRPPQTDFEKYFCQGEREFYEADGSIPDPEMMEKILEADCIVSLAEVSENIFSAPQATRCSCGGIFLFYDHHTG